MPAEAFRLGAASAMTRWNPWQGGRWLWVLFLAAGAYGQTCQTASDMDAQVRTALETTAKRYFEMSARGDVAGLKQSSIASLAGNFAGVESAVRENQDAFAGAKATVRSPFLLTADGPEPLAHGEFLCGVFGKTGQTKDSAVFILNNLPPGNYAVTVVDVSGGKAATTLTFVLQKEGSAWKLAGFNTKALEASGHDAAWFTQRAREFKAKSQNHNAWLYYREAIALSVPVEFMSTLDTDKLYDEVQTTQSSDLPANGNTVDLKVGGTVYHLTEVFPVAVGNDLDVEVKYQAADVSDTAHAFQENMVVIKALVAKFPEFRDAFVGVVARAVDPAGHEYGSLMATKDIK
jgi:hypothetical protein